jgi:septum formation protein
VLAADTTVTLDRAIVGKADTPEEATKMLRGLAGRTHRVLTAFVLVGERDGKTCVREGLVSSEVVMVDCDAATLADYVASGEWRGKAGRTRSRASARRWSAGCAARSPTSSACRSPR